MTKKQKKDLLPSLKRELKSKFVLFLVTLIFVLLIIVFLDFKITMLLSFQEHAKWAHCVSDLASTLPLMVLLIIIYSVSFIKNQYSKFHGCIRVSTLAFVAVLIVGGILKLLIARTRPYVDLNPYDFFSYSHLISHHINKYLSMPSDHTLRVAAIILPFIFAYKQRVVRTVLWCIIALVMYCRVATLNHWTSDVVAGLIIGIAITYFIYKNAEIYRRKE